MLRRSFLAAAWVGLVVLALAPGAAARAAQLPGFQVDGTRGWKIDVWANPAGPGHGSQVGVSIWKPHATTTYIGPGRVGANGFSADFRHFGWLDVQYRPGPPRTVKDCRGHPRRQRGGTFTGTFEFHGTWQFTEADYPFLDVHPLSDYADTCGGATTGGRKGVKLDALSGFGRTKVFQSRPGGRVHFIAQDGEEYGDLKIFRYAEANAPARDLVLGPDLRWAKVTPPAPFHGTASFSRGRLKDNWRGNLNVDFPGFRGFPLTWHPTVAFLERGSCTIHAPRRPQPPVPCI